MKRLFILWLVLFGPSSVANAGISAAYISGSTGYLELYDNPALTALPATWVTLDMIEVGQLANGNTIAAYTSGGTDYLELYDATMSPITNIALNGVISVAGLANGDIVAATGSSMQILDGTTLAGGASLALNVIDVTGLQNGNIAAAYTSGGSDYVRIYDGATLAVGANISLNGIAKVTGVENGDVSVLYGAGTKYLQMFDGSSLASGNWANVTEHGVKDIAGLAGGDILLAYNPGTSLDYMEALAPLAGSGGSVTWRAPWAGFTSITAVEGDYLIELVPPVCGDENHPYPAGDATRDCKVNFEDFVYIACSWLDCTHPDGCD